MSRQKLARSLDYQEVARNNGQIDLALAQATANTEGFLHRGFFPWYGTRYFDWPNRDNPVNWRIRLDDHDLIELTSGTAGGTTLTPANMLLYPKHGPPFTAIETSVAGSSFYQSGNTWQNALAFTGLWGYRNDVRNVATLVGTINASQTTLVFSPSVEVGVGDVLKIDNEYLVVRGLTTSTSGQTLQTPLTASAASTAVAVTTGSAFLVDEVITLDTESMLIVGITGNTLIVKRAWDGSVLATHTGSTIYVSRTATVDRGACASTAASHTTGVTIAQHVIPASVQALTLAEAGWIYAGHSSGWQIANNTSRNVPSEEGLLLLNDLRATARRAVGRKGRQRAA